MKLGIIASPEAASFDHAKELGLDFVEFDCNPVSFLASLLLNCLLKRKRSKKPASAPAWKLAL